MITLATSIPAGSNFTGNSTETSYNALQTNLPPLCRVAFTVRTSPNSTAQAEVWLPHPSAWNDRFLSVGNGGFAGGSNYPDIVWGARKGFATMSIDMGHDSTQSDGSWMLNNPEAMIDFGHRALHVTTGVAKRIVKAYYGEGERYAYYAGCSTGGRQGLKAAQRYPEDYDGVLVGSAIPSQTNTSTWQTYVALEQFLNNRSSYIPTSKWSTIHEAVLDQCDEVDGVEDGIITNPRNCDFHAQVLLCDNLTINTNCLNPDQLRSLQRMYLPWLDSMNNTVNPGISTSGKASFSYLMNDAEPQFGPSFYRYAVLNNSTWDWSTMSLEMARFAEEMNPGGMNAYNPDMRAFEAKGGKLMEYHGSADSLILDGVAGKWHGTVDKFYENIGRGEDVAKFYRLFIVPGMGHCSGGVGAWVLDVASQAGIVPLQTGDSHSMLWSLVQWVEGGKEPKSIVGTKYVNDVVALGLGFERVLCPWPDVARFVQAEGRWVCPAVQGY